MAQLLVALGIALAAYVLLFAAMAVRTRPRTPVPAEPTMDVPDDATPAVVGFITNGWGVPRAAVPATLVDLAARGLVEIQHLGPGEFTVRLKDAAAGASAPYEQRVYDLVRSLERNGEVPGDALTTGAPDEASRWWKSFKSEVVADARARGWTRPRWRGSELALLFFASLPASLLGATAVLRLPSDSSDDRAQAFLGLTGLFVFLLLVPLGWLRDERDTPAGLAAAGRWLGVRRFLAADESFAEQPPAAVAVWDRLLSYGTALGVARGVVRELPMGGESDTEAWSAYGGEWHIVRVHYPRLRPDWGRSPVIVAFQAIPPLLGAVFVGVVASRHAVSAPVLVPVRVVVGAAAGLGLHQLAVALSDMGKRRTVRGRLVRVRPGLKRGGNSNGPPTTTYLAIDDGSSAEVRAFLADNDKCGEVRQGDEVTVVVTPRLGYVRSIQNEG